MTTRLPLLIALWLGASSVFAQDVALPGVGTDNNVTVEQLEAAVELVSAREELDEELRNRVIQHLRDSQAQIQSRIASETAAAAYTEALNTAPAQTEALREELDTESGPPPSAESLGITDETSLDELSLALSRELAEQATLESTFTEIEAQVAAQGSRPAEARRRTAELRASRDSLSASLQAAPPDEPQPLTDARMVNTELRRVAASAEINALEQELISHAVRLELLKARLDVAERERLQGQRRIDFLRGQVNEKRQAAASEAQQSAEVIEQEAADKHQEVRALAEANASLTREAPLIAADIDQATFKLEQSRNEARTLEQRLERSRQRLEIGGLTRSIGVLLVEESRNLPQFSQYRVQINNRGKVLADVGLAQMRTQEQRRGLTSLESSVEAVMAVIAEDVTDEEELAATRIEVRTLLRDRRDLLIQSENHYSTYLKLLGDLDIAQRGLLELVAEYQEFLRQNLLWIPSAPIVFTGDWQKLGPSATAALNPGTWRETTSDLVDSIESSVFEAILALLILVALLVGRKPLAGRAESMNEKVGRLSVDSIGLTIAALGIAAIRALPVPAVLAMLGWFLTNAPEHSSFSSSVAAALSGTAPFLYNVLLFRALSAADGALRVHFGWRSESLAIIRKQLDRIATIGAPLVFGTVLFYSSDVAFDRATMGRLLFILLMLVLSVSLRPIAHPESGVVADYYRKNQDKWVSKLRWVWHVLAVGTPLLLCVVSMLGYLYTSLILTSLLVDTIWLALALLVINMVLLRWIALTHRKLAFQMALREREAKRASQEAESDQDTEGDMPVVEAKPLDLDEVDAQTRELLRWGLLLVAVIAGWGIWSEVFPAFRLFDSVSLWSQTTVVDGVETVLPVTLANLLLAALIAAGTTIAARNLPGLMEIAILQRLTLAPGSRYAINTLVRYVVITIGLISVLNTIGWNWSQIQWLVAALSVGLGFGLQEIVANFVSGLIILFERPVRVGDTVTVGQLSGTVSRVQIRATTITDWDRKEIIVPNKAFITEQVINWTLADPITRVVVPVGISYGSDVELAHKVMEDTLRSLPLVLDEPEPQVFFLGFGDSSLDFSLRAFSRQLADRLPLMHTVHNAILKALRENGIEIPFPQRDLHIRSTVEKK